MRSKIYEYLENIEGELTAHLSGLRNVFLRNEDTNTKLTQFAFGKFKSGEICKSHTHGSMEELFYFISGNGEYIVDGEIILIKPGTFLRIPAGLAHELRNTSKMNLEFVYFGVAID